MHRMKIIAIVIAFLTMLIWMLQVVALADDKGYVKWSDRCGSGMFVNSCGSKSLRDSSCKAVADHAKVAAAFGVMAVLLMSFTWVTHTLLAITPINEMLMATLKYRSFILNHLWKMHLLIAIFLLVCWCTLTGLYYRELCHDKIQSHASLQHGFAFLIVNDIAEVLLTFLCTQRRHLGAFAELLETAPAPARYPNPLPEMEKRKDVGDRH
eukprot:TRINITY_DN16119_c0_g2_i7.p1 TRINITY_DN16119_c0_g2~~TRINITY_DN16119_c0_g2_i7.p1  ORF type:complete len:210 (+),score=51.43 TRINITY_DN16119_c0_g2_i7:67-696(+)